MHHPHGQGHQHSHDGWSEAERTREEVKLWSTWVGLGLCVVLFLYLTHLAKRALARAQSEQERLAAEEEGLVAMS